MERYWMYDNVYHDEFRRIWKLFRVDGRITREFTGEYYDGEIAPQSSDD